MQDPIKELKVRAELLQRHAQNGEAPALERVRKVREFSALSDIEVGEQVRRKHCLGVVAREAGFRDWSHASRVLEGDPAEQDYGTLLYGRRCHGMLNHWFADLAEAREQLATLGGTLLPYKRQFIVVAAPFLQALGLGPEDPDLQRMGNDWLQPRDAAARSRLYVKVLKAQAA